MAQETSVTTNLLNINKILSEHNIFLTGCSGFVGMQILERLLSIPSSFKSKIYVLLRNSSKFVDIYDRLRKEVLSNELFDAYHDQLDNIIGNKVIPVHGDLTEENLGIAEKDMLTLKNELKNSLFIHCAADVQFDRPLNMAMDINVYGTYSCAQFAKLCCANAFLYISTMYCNCREYTDHRIMEGLYDQGFDQKKLFYHWLNDCNKNFTDKEIETIMKLKRNNYNITEWPNTYTLTKSIAEVIAVDTCKNIMPINVARLGIISPVAKGKHSGWFSGNGGFVFFGIGAATGHIKYLVGNGGGRPDFVPVDYTVDALMGISANLLIQSYEFQQTGHYNLLSDEAISMKTRQEVVEKESIEFGTDVYQIGIAAYQPQDWCVATIMDYVTPRFHAAKVPGTKPNAHLVFIESQFWFWILELIAYDIPLLLMFPLVFIFGLISKRFTKKYNFMSKARSKLKWFHANYSFFMNQKWKFDHSNVKYLFENKLDEESKKLYNFDVTIFDLNLYALESAIIVIKKWYSQRAQKKQKEKESKEIENNGTFWDIIRRLSMSLGGIGVSHIGISLIITLFLLWIVFQIA